MSSSKMVSPKNTRMTLNTDSSSRRLSEGRDKRFAPDRVRDTAR